MGRGISPETVKKVNPPAPATAVEGILREYWRWDESCEKLLVLVQLVLVIPILDKAKKE